MAITDYIVGFRNYVAGLINPEEKEHGQLSMIEICLEYFPEEFFTTDFGSGATLMRMEQIYSGFSILNDDETYAVMTREYGFSDEKARQFVSDSKSFREDARAFRKLEREILRNKK